MAWLCFVACFFVPGCATTEKITADILGKGERLNKKLAFLPPVKGAGYGGEDFQQAAEAHLKAFLSRRCDNVRIMDSRNVRQALDGMPRLASGQVDHLALAKVGRIFGLSAVVSQTVGPMELIKEKRGIWGFRRLSRLARLSLRVTVYDVQSTAIVLDEIVAGDVEVSQDDQAGQGYNQGMASRLLAQITPKTGKAICEHLAEEPWKGYIVAGSKKTLTLSAGTDVGLNVGDVLEVFGLGEPMKGQEGHIYLVAGPKIGEIRVTKLMKDRAEAAPILGYDLEESSFVQLKR
jgi:hypothetical protein